MFEGVYDVPSMAVPMPKGNASKSSLQKASIVCFEAPLIASKTAVTTKTSVAKMKRKEP